MAEDTTKHSANLTADNLATKSPEIGAPNIDLRVSFADLHNLDCYLKKGIALFQEMQRLTHIQLKGLNRQERRAADVMDEMWPPDGRPPIDLNLADTTKAVKRRFKELKQPSPPGPDTISRLLRKRGYRD
jgi:hypothetical protein